MTILLPAISVITCCRMSCSPSLWTVFVGLLQSLLVAVCLGLTMVIRLIPSAVLWGYFAFMALESLGGSQFWERLVYLMTDPAKRYR